VHGKGGGWRLGGEMTQALYAHMNNKRKKKKKWTLTSLNVKGIYTSNLFSNDSKIEEQIQIYSR
jgi:hypothetical protein